MLRLYVIGLWVGVKDYELVLMIYIICIKVKLCAYVILTQIDTLDILQMINLRVRIDSETFLNLLKRLLALK